MEIEELKPAMKRVKSKRVGRGIGSGLGKTSGRGQKGQKARSGGGVRRGFEGGQTPLYRRLPKRGFTNIHAKNYTEVTLTMLNKSEATDVTAETLLAEGIIGKIQDGIVVLATGKLEKKCERNMKHDKDVTAMFEARGWKVLRIWECELKKRNETILVEKIQSILSRSSERTQR